MKATIRLSEVPLHLYPILAGFRALEKKGVLDLKIIRLSEGDLGKLPYNMMEVTMEDGKTLIYDMNDGYENLLPDASGMVPFYNELLCKCDLLYKRSFDPVRNEKLSAPEKMRRTPPNFLVTSRMNPAHFPVPCDPKREKVKKLIRMVPGSSYYNGHILEKNLFDTPRFTENPKVLFMARLWDPAGEFAGQLTKAMQDERKEINEMRVQCIRNLRKEFGSQFCGGITPSPFASENYPDVVLENAALSRKDKYLDFMKSFDIHITTMGLHGSTGWKFAEYMAASKAIVCEPLCYESAGGLADGKHYLSFTDAAGCIEQVSTLFDADKRNAMMQNNYDYAQKYLRPEAFVRYTLEDAGYTL